MPEVTFIAKKIISFFLTPLGALLLLGLAAWGLSRERPGLSRVCLASGLILLLALSIPLTGRLLLKPLETAYCEQLNLAQLEERGIKNIVVLGAGARGGDNSIFDQLGGHGLNRILAAVDLYRQQPGYRLYLSGGGREAMAMAGLALHLGVAAPDMILENLSQDTADQARLLKPLLGQKPFALVTSAWHMSRAMLLFSQQGLQAIPAPTDFQSRDLALSLDALLPGAQGLRLSELALKEYAGWLWAWLTG